MKKIIVLLLALCIVMCACSEKKVSKPSETTVKTTENSVVTIPTSTTEISVTEEVTTEETTISISPTDTFVTVKESPSYGSDVLVEYDILTVGIPEIDEVFKNEAEAALLRCIPDISSVSHNNGSAEYYSVMSDFYMDDNIASAVFSGAYLVSYEGASTENRGRVFYTVNVDKNSGKLIGGKEIISDFALLTEAFENGEFSPQGAEPYASNLSQYLPEYNMYPYISMDEDNFYLYISSSEVGDFYTTYTISIEDASKFINEKYRPAVDIQDTVEETEE